MLEITNQPYDYLDESMSPIPSPIYRLNASGKRYYYEIIDGTPVIYASGTTIISDGYPEKTKAMEQWRVSMRVQGHDPDKYAAYRADYGTVMHVAYGDYLTGKPISLYKLDEYVRKLDCGISPTRLEEIINGNLWELKKDLLSFAVFVKKHNVKPLGMELMMASRKYGCATAVDLICEMDVEETGDWGVVYKSGANKDKPKMTKQINRRNAIVDFKSGKKGFYDKHALQLLTNEKIVKENYPDLKIDYLFNFAPKEWRTKPDYHLKDQTNNPIKDELEDVLSLGLKRHKKKLKTSKNFTGSLEMSTFDLEKHYNVFDIVEKLKEKHQDGSKEKGNA